MRITQELLHKFARETIKMRKRSEPDLHAAYLTGSLLEDEPLLGGATDIDLVLVHKYQVPVERETQAITHEISLDIVHKLKEDYDQYRQLRQDPYLGYPLTKSHILLYDTDHWLEYIQAGVAADFHRTDNVLFRVNGFLDSAREKWFTLESGTIQNHLEWLHTYTDILALAANAVSGLIGPPLTTRRFLLIFAERVETLGVPKVLAGFDGLIGYSEAVSENFDRWLAAFQTDLVQVADTATPPVNLAPCRHAYYLNAIRAIAESGSYEGALWPLLQTWLDVQLCADPQTARAKAWDDCLETLQLSTEYSAQKIEALDAYLDTIELIVEEWADVYGI